jgi:hypothetical protein
MSEAFRPDPTNPTEQLAEWWNFSEKKRTVAGLGIAFAAALIASLVLATREPEQITVTEPNMLPAQSTFVTVTTQNDLGEVGAPYGKNRLQMLALNPELTQQNTKKCDQMKRTDGICTRTMFAGQTLAWDALWEGDQVNVGVVENAALASTTP